MAKTIEDYKKDYAAAQARGDKEGMAAANNAANTLRQQQGQAVQVADVTKEVYGSNYVGAPQKSNATSGIVTSTSEQQSIKDQMAANSDAWHTATSQEEKDRLHAENQKLAGQLGGSVSFNPSTGTWTGSAQQQSTTVTDYSNYLEEMYAAQRKQALAQLNSAYQSNLNAINQSAVGVDAQYQNARNQAAGASELSARNFAEYAAATGLNSGAAGQAELARNVALQNDLTSLAQNEADFYSNIELQKQQAEIDYNNAIAEAEASNDYAAAQALYQEKVRVQNALIEQQWQQMQFDLQKQSIALQEAQQNTANQQWQQQFDYGKESDQINRLISTGQAALESGLMPSSDALAAMGITAQQAQSYIDYYNMIRSVQTQQAQAELSAYQAAASGTGSKNSGGSDSGSGNDSPVWDSAPQYDNGSLSAQQIMQMQTALGVTADGYWGPASQKAAGGLSADEAWSSLKYKIDSGLSGVSDVNFRGIKQTLYTKLTQLGDGEGAEKFVDQVWDTLSSKQQEELTAYLKGLGYTMTGG